MNPYQVVRDFEAAVAEYTGAPYVVSVNSCTMALLLAVAWHLRQPPTRVAHAGDLALRRKWLDMGTVLDDKPLPIEIPKLTYVSVPMSIIHAGGRPTFRDEDWTGAYQLKPLPVWDSARWFTSGLYKGVDEYEHIPGRPYSGIDKIKVLRDCAGSFVCVSFHASKTLGDTQGGAILHDNPEADGWLRRMRFDGRTEGVAPCEDDFREIGYHCYISADVAARLLLKMNSLPRHNEPLPNDDYPDLSAMSIFNSGP